MLEASPASYTHHLFSNVFGYPTPPHQMDQLPTAYHHQYQQQQHQQHHHQQQQYHHYSSILQQQHQQQLFQSYPFAGQTQFPSPATTADSVATTSATTSTAATSSNNQQSQSHTNTSSAPPPNITIGFGSGHAVPSKMETTDLPPSHPWQQFMTSTSMARNSDPSSFHASTPDSSTASTSSLSTPVQLPVADQLHLPSKVDLPGSPSPPTGALFPPAGAHHQLHNPFVYQPPGAYDLYHHHRHQQHLSHHPLSLAAATPVGPHATNWVKTPSQHGRVPGFRTGPGSNNIRVRTREKYRMVYTEYQRFELEKEFCFSQFITSERKAKLSDQLELTERQIKIWFQNRRAKQRRVVVIKGDDSSPSDDADDKLSDYHLNNNNNNHNNNNNNNNNNSGLLQRLHHVQQQQMLNPMPVL